jgi:type I restriction enzyme M protein
VSLAIVPVWMLFLKIFDDKESEWELMEDRYRSPIPERLRWRKLFL